MKNFNLYLGSFIEKAKLFASIPVEVIKESKLAVFHEEAWR